MQAIAMIYSIVAAVCVLDVVSARREQRASFALAYRQARGGKETGALVVVVVVVVVGLKPGVREGAGQAGGKRRLTEGGASYVNGG